MKLAEPVLVYLDSQDFIRMTDEMETPVVKETVDRLKDLRSRRVCEFGYSYLHVVEVLNPNSEGFEKEQRAYGETISSFTDGAFPILNDLIAGARYPNDGIWAPLDLHSQFNDFLTEKQIRTYFRDAIAQSGENLTRQQRQQAKARKGRAKIVDALDIKAPDALRLLGFTDGDFKGMILRPELYRKRLHAAIMAFMVDPRTYSEAVSSVERGSDPFREAVDRNLNPAFSSLVKYYDEWQNYLIKAKDIRRSADRILHGLSGIDMKEGDTYRAVKRLKKRVKLEPPKLDLSSKFGDDQSRFRFLVEYASRMVKMEKRPIQSEVKDLMHLMYAEDVDLIRVDGRIGEIIKGNKEISDKVVRKFEMLPDRIEKIAMKKQTLGG